MYITNLLENTFPKNIGETTEEQLLTIRNYLYQLNEQLRYIFNNLEAENFNETELENMKKEFLAPIETVVKDLEGNLTSIKQGFDKIESTVKDMDGKVSKVTQTVDGWTFVTDEGETAILGDKIKSGTISGTNFECSLYKNDVVGTYNFYDRRSDPDNEYPVGAIEMVGGADPTIWIRTNEGGTWKLKIGSYANVSLQSYDESVWIMAKKQVVLSGENAVRIASPNGVQYVFRDDGIYYNGKRIVDNTKAV